MAEGYEIGSAFVSILPTAKGLTGRIDSELTKSFRGVGKSVERQGKQSGGVFARAFSASAAKNTEQLEQMQKRLAATVRQTSKQVKSAREDEEAAARKVRIAEAQLSEARSTGKKSASQLLSIEDRLALSQRKLATARGATAAATVKLRQQETEQAQALQRSEQAADKAGRAFSGLGARIRGAVSGKNAPDFSNVPKAADKAGRKAGRSFGTGFGATLKGVVGGGLVLGALSELSSSLTGFASQAYGEARESQKVGALTNQVIKTTGGVANISAKQVGNLATAISNKTGIDDEAVQAASNLLLTFKGVRNEVGKGNDVFNQATQIATDMGAALGKSPKAGAIQLGKALNDPIKGITALTRVGVSFTDQQKAQIKTLVSSGNTLGAQKIILKELQSEFGGAAAASSTAGEKFTTSFNNFKEQLGTAALPVLDKFFGFMTKTGFPALSKFAGFLTEKVGPGLKSLGAVLSPVLAPVKTFISTLFSGKGEAPPWLTAIRNALPAVVPLIKAGLGTVVGLFRQLQPVIGTVIGAVIGVIRRLAPVLVGLAGPVRAIVSTVIGVARGVLPIVLQVVGTVIGAIRANLPQLKAIFVQIATVISQVGQLITTIWSKIGPIVLPIIRTLIGTIISVIGGVVKVVSGILNILIGIFTGNFDKIKQGGLQVFNGLKQIIVAIVKNILGQAKVIATAIAGVLFKLVGFVASKFRAGFALLVGFVRVPLIAARNFVATTIATVRNTFFSILSWIGSAFRTGFAKITGFILNPVRAARDAIGKILDALKTAFSKAVDSIKSAFESIKAAAKEPIRFVVNTVLEDGILAAFRKIAGAVGLDSLAGKMHVSLPKGFASGGWTGPGRRMQPAGIVHADEHVIRKRSRRRLEQDLPGGLDYLNKTGRWPVGPLAETRGVNQQARRGRAAPVGGNLPAALASLVRRGPRRSDRSGFGANSGSAVGFGSASVGQMGWYNRCLAFVNRAWDYTVSRFRLATARDSMNAGPRSMKGIPPGGAGLYWDTGPAGHIALAAGNGDAFSNDIRAAGRIDRVPQTEINKWGPYKGWWHPQGLPGRDGDLSAGGSGFDILGGLRKSIAGALDKLKGIGGGTLGQIVAGAPRMLADALISKVSNFAGAVGDTVGGVLQGAKLAAILTTALTMNRLPITLLDNWVRQVASESGGNAGITQGITDVNSRSGNRAQGLLQVIPPTFAAYRSKFLPNDPFNPLSNAYAAMNYAKHNYRDLEAVIGHGHGYARGTTSARRGLNVVGENGPELQYHAGGETVIPNDAIRGLGSLGKFVTSGLVSGLIAGIPRAAAAGRSLAGSVVSAVRDELGIASPSKVMAQIAVFINQGLAKGLRGSAATVLSTVKSLTANVAKLFEARGQLAKDKLVDRLELRVKRLKSIDKRSKAQNRSLAVTEKALAKARKLDPGPGAVKSSQAFMNAYKSATDRLSKLATQRATVAAKLTAARDKLTAAIKTRDDYAAGIRNTVLDSGNIGSLSGVIQASQVTDTLKARLANWKSFFSNLAKLRKLGLGLTSYRQLLEAGPDAAGGVVRALLAGGKGSIGQVNSLQVQLGQLGASAGKQAAGTLYQAGVDSAQGLVRGLQSQDKALTAAANRLADTLVKAVKKKLKIKSPSRVMFEQGVNTGTGYVQGVQSTAAAVAAASRQLAVASVPVTRSSTQSAAGGDTNNFYGNINDFDDLERRLDNRSGRKQRRANLRANLQGAL